MECNLSRLWPFFVVETENTMQGDTKMTAADVMSIRAVIESDPLNPENWNVLADCYWDSGAEEESIVARVVAEKLADNWHINNCPMTRQYLETALWSSMDESDDRGGEPMDANYSLDDIAPVAIVQALEDCVRFAHANAPPEGFIHSEWETFGHCLWLSRNGHGAGFFDREDAFGMRLCHDWQQAAERMKEVNAYIGDDGLIYFARG